MVIDVPVVETNYCSKGLYFTLRLIKICFCPGYKQRNKDAYQGEFGGPVISIDMIFFVKIYDTMI